MNMAGNCIVDDEACREASCQEIIRRYYHTLVNIARGKAKEEEAYKIELLMNRRESPRRTERWWRPR